MKLLLSVFLLISEFFSIIKTGMGLKCFQNDNAKQCLQLLKQLNPEEEETEFDKKRLEAINCMMNNHNKTSLIECKYFTGKCNKLDVKFQDENEMSFKFCDTHKGEVCELSKLLFKDQFQDDIVYAICDNCGTDQCNSDSKPGEDFFCYTTSFESECTIEMINLLTAAKERRGNYDEARSDALICWEHKKSENLTPCPMKGRCSTLTLNFKDGIQVVSKKCDFQFHSICEEKKKLLQTDFGDRLSSAHCDFCSESHCNKDLKNSSHPEGERPLCWVSKHMCDYDLIQWYKARAGMQGDPDKLRSEALNCLKNVNLIELLLIPCTMENSVCSKLILNFKDGVESVFKFCDSKSICKNFKKQLEKDFEAELDSVKCDCDNCDSNQIEPSSEIPNPPESPPEVKQNKSSSRSSSSRIHVSVFVLFLILVAFFI